MAQTDLPPPHTITPSAQSSAKGASGRDQQEGAESEAARRILSSTRDERKRRFKANHPIRQTIVAAIDDLGAS